MILIIFKYFRIINLDNHKVNFKYIYNILSTKLRFNNYFDIYLSYLHSALNDEIDIKQNNKSNEK